MMLWFMSRCHNKDVIFVFKMSLLSERHHIQDTSCHGYKGIMLVLCTPLQVKCYRRI